MNEIAQRVPLYAKMSYERLRITARRRSSVQTVGGDSVEPVELRLANLFGDISGVDMGDRFGINADAKFDVKFVEPKAEQAGQADGTWR